MKKSFLLISLLIFAFSLTSKAQTQKHVKLIGGTAGMNFTNHFMAGIDPTVGYFVANNLAIGSYIPLNYFKVRDSQSVLIGMNPYARYYLGKSRTRMFAHVEGGISRSWNFGTDQIKYARTDKYIGAGLGAVHFLTKQVGLQAILKYTNSFTSITTIHNDVTLRFGLQIHLPSRREEKVNY